MSTQLEDVGDKVAVSTVSAPGNRKRMARGRVLVPKGDLAALKAEMMRQALALRAEMGVATTPGGPVV